MLPFHPPLPTAWNLPFQPDAGSQTSILMSDSGVGVSVAATRQNAGRSLNCAAPPRPPGAVNAPAATDCADVMVAPDSFIDDRLSQVAANAESAPSVSRTATANGAMNRADVECVRMWSSSE